jgi:hypothetical protein
MSSVVQFVTIQGSRQWGNECLSLEKVAGGAQLWNKLTYCGARKLI